MRLDDVIVLAMVLLAVAYMGHRLWRRLHAGPRPDAGGGCGSCGGCDGASTAQRSCNEAPLLRRD